MTSRYAEREQQVRERYERLAPTLQERGRRLFAANEAVQFGYGGIEAVRRATGLASSTIVRGIAELSDLETLAPPHGKQRQPGAGGKRIEEFDPGIVSALDKLIDPATRGDPESPLRWTSKSTRKLASELTRQGHRVSADTVARMLKERGYTLQANRKTKEGSNHIDRAAQFEHINALAKRFQEAGQPSISVDTKKKELVGEYKNAGQEWHPKGNGQRR